MKFEVRLYQDENGHDGNELGVTFEVTIMCR